MRSNLPSFECGIECSFQRRRECFVQQMNVDGRLLGANSSGYGFLLCIPYKIEKENAQCEQSIWFCANSFNCIMVLDSLFENTSEFCRVDTIVCVSKPLNVNCSATVGVFNESDKNGDNKQHTRVFLSLG